MKSDYITDIGIECHVQLKTASKLFCGCSNDAREAAPNTLLCPVCLGLPGTLPLLNKRAVELAIQAGYALEAEVATETKFDRKNYFYPDLPKGYQITQYDMPIVGQGAVEVPLDDSSFTVRITRAHLEEDAGKLIHPEGVDYSLVDLNRAGTPLLEIVSEPDMHSPEQAKAYAQELHARMRYAEVSDVDLYYGNMRFDLNVSVRLAGSETLGTRSETKNLNSFRSIERAAAHEVQRQIKVLEAGAEVVQETRGWDESKTYSLRTKEEAADYRYFPEPDIPPLEITDAMKTEVADQMPPLLNTIRQSLAEAQLSKTQTEALLNQPALLKLQLEVIERAPQYAQTAANWLSGEVVRLVHDEEFEWRTFKLDSQRLIELAKMAAANDLSSTGAKTVLAHLTTSSDSPQAIAESNDLLQVSDTGELEAIVDQVIAANAQAAQDVRDGEMKAIGFLVGQVMQASKGQANPQIVQQLLKDKLTDS